MIQLQRQQNLPYIQQEPQSQDVQPPSKIEQKDFFRQRSTSYFCDELEQKNSSRLLSSRRVEIKTQNTIEELKSFGQLIKKQSIIMKFTRNIMKNRQISKTSIIKNLGTVIHHGYKKLLTGEIEELMKIKKQQSIEYKQAYVQGKVDESQGQFNEQMPVNQNENKPLFKVEESQDVSKQPVQKLNTDKLSQLMDLDQQKPRGQNEKSHFFEQVKVEESQDVSKQPVQKLNTDKLSQLMNLDQQKPRGQNEKSHFFEQVKVEESQDVSKQPVQKLNTDKLSQLMDLDQQKPRGQNEKSHFFEQVKVEESQNVSKQPVQKLNTDKLSQLMDLDQQKPRGQNEKSHFFEQVKVEESQDVSKQPVQKLNTDKLSQLMDLDQQKPRGQNEKSHFFEQVKVEESQDVSKQPVQKLNTDKLSQLMDLDQQKPRGQNEKSHFFEQVKVEESQDVSKQPVQKLNTDKLSQLMNLDQQKPRGQNEKSHFFEQVKVEESQDVSKQPVQKLNTDKLSQLMNLDQQNPRGQNEKSHFFEQVKVEESQDVSKQTVQKLNTDKLQELLNLDEQQPRDQKEKSQFLNSGKVDESQGHFNEQMPVNQNENNPSFDQGNDVENQQSVQIKFEKKRSTSYFCDELEQKNSSRLLSSRRVEIKTQNTIEELKSFGQLIKKQSIIMKFTRNIMKNRQISKTSIIKNLGTVIHHGYKKRLTGEIEELMKIKKQQSTVNIAAQEYKQTNVQGKVDESQGHCNVNQNENKPLFDQGKVNEVQDVPSQRLQRSSTDKLQQLMDLDQQKPRGQNEKSHFLEQVKVEESQYVSTNSPAVQEKEQNFRQVDNKNLTNRGKPPLYMATPQIQKQKHQKTVKSTEIKSQYDHVIQKLTLTEQNIQISGSNNNRNYLSKSKSSNNLTNRYLFIDSPEQQKKKQLMLEKLEQYEKNKEIQLQQQQEQQKKEVQIRKKVNYCDFEIKKVVDTQLKVKPYEQQMRITNDQSQQLQARKLIEKLNLEKFEREREYLNKVSQKIEIQIKQQNLKNSLSLNYLKQKNNNLVKREIVKSSIFI